MHRRLPRPWRAAASVAAAAFLILAGPPDGTPAGAATPTPKPTTPATPTLPVPSATVDPALSVGGPRLASMGVITDLPAGVPAPPQMRDVAWLVADADTGEIIAAKAPHARLGPASTLKTLTALTLIPRIDARRAYAAEDSDAQAGGTRIGLVPGQVYTGRQLFEALLMGSANDAAYLLARINGGLERTLADMNAEARRLGALDTVAGNPAGLDTPGQGSSAYDLALFGRAALQDKAFRTYSTTLQVPFPGLPVPTATPTPRKTSTRPPSTRPTPTPTAPRLRDARGILRDTYALTNHNRLLWNYPGAIGIKNGWTDLAKRTFIGAASRGGKTYLVTEMYGLESGMSWRSTGALLDWAFAHGQQARPVGHLVVPGEALPTATPSTTTPTTSDAPTGTRDRVTPTGPAAAAVAHSPGARAFFATADRADLTVLGGTALVVILGLALLATRLRRRRGTARHRGTQGSRP